MPDSELDESPDWSCGLLKPMCAQIERRLVLRLIEASWLTADLSVAFRLAACAQWSKQRKASRKKRKDAGVKRKAALVPVVLDDAAFNFILEGEVTDDEAKAKP